MFKSGFNVGQLMDERKLYKLKVLAAAVDSWNICRVHTRLSNLLYDHLYMNGNHGSFTHTKFVPLQRNLHIALNDDLLTQESPDRDRII